MKLELEVIASTSIKRKKPWPKLAFLGKVVESIVLLDDQRASVLYLPSGKTKKKIPKIHSLLQEAVTQTTSGNGHFLCGLLKSGDLFIWHKDSGLLKFIPGRPELTKHTQTHGPGPGVTDCPRYSIYISDDASKVVAVSDTSDIYVWEIDPNQHLFDTSSSVVKGTWSHVSSPDGTLLPGRDNKETSVTAIFTVNEARSGLCSIISFVFTYNQNVCITSAVLSWCDSQNIFAYRQPTYTAQWTTIEYPLTSLAPLAQPINCPGVYVTQFSHDGNLLAVAVNQLDTYKNRMLFVSIWTETVVVVNMNGMGTKEPVTKNARSHWTVDLAWTPDDLFLTCMTKQGSLCIMTRLGEPLMLQSFGCNIEMGPKPFLQLHPLISVSVAEDTESHQTEREALASYHKELKDPLRQRFSVSSHPDIPLLLVSDGYMVTAVQLPFDTTCLSVMRGLVHQSNRHLRRIRDQQKIQLTLFDSLKKQGAIGPKVNMKTGRLSTRLGLLPEGSTIKFQGPVTKTPQKEAIVMRYRFEEEEEDTGLDTTMDSEIADFILAGDVNIGKITFGDVENLNQTMDFGRFTQEEGLSIAEHILRAQRQLTLAWGLSASHTGLWTSDHEDICHNIVHNMVKLFMCLIHCDNKVLRELNTLQGLPNKKKTKDKQGLIKVLNLFKNVMHMLQMDCGQQHLMVCAFGFVSSVVELILHDRHLHKKLGRLQTLNLAYLLTKYCDMALGKLYGRVPERKHHFGLGYTQNSSCPLDLYTPSLLSYLDLPKMGDKNHSKPGPVSPSLNVHSPPGEQKGLMVDGLSEVDDGYSSQLPSARSLLDVHITAEEQTVLETPLQQQKRLLPVWRLLYKHTAEHHQALSKTIAAQPEGDEAISHSLEHSYRLVSLIQATIHKLGGQLPVRSKVKLQPGNKHYVEGCTGAALASWTNLLSRIPDVKLEGNAGSHILHAVFYALILDDKLRAAILLVELLIRQSDLRKAVNICRQKEETKMSLISLLQQVPEKKPTTPVSMLTSKASQQLVQSLARLMAAYFSNKTLFIFPPHAPQKIPPLHTQYQIKHRVMPLYPNKVSNIVRRDDLGSVWTAERTLEYLMISGLYPEALWFVHELGDWKTSFVMAVASQLHQKLKPDVHSCKKLRTPESLTPENIMKDHLKSAFFPEEETIGKGQHLVVDENTDFDHLSKIMGDILLAATLCEIDIVPWLLQGLVGRLKSLACRFPPLVPQGLYLPAPPVYCPQPALSGEESLGVDVLEEVVLRRETSSVLILILLVLNSSNTTLPSASWYAQRVINCLAKGMKLKKQKQDEVVLDIQVLQEAYLTETSMFDGKESNASVHTVLSSFRDLCSVTWMLYARDKLSLALRTKAKMADKKLNRPDTVTADDWQSHCRTTLDWAVHLHNFSSFLSGPSQLHGIILSLILELPQTTSTAKILAEHFSDPESMDPETQDKLQWILKEWQGVFLEEGSMKRRDSKNGEIKVESRRGVTMSLAFHSNMNRADKLRHRRVKAFGKYEDQVFAGVEKESCSQNGVLSVGSRYFESDEEYLKFLDVFYAVSFNRLLDNERENQTTDEQQFPLLVKYVKHLHVHELNSVSHKAMESHRKHHNPNKISIQAPKMSAPQTVVSDVQISSRAIPPTPPRAKGLFRSRSMSELWNADGSRINGLQRQKSTSHDDLVLHMPPSGKQGSKSPRGMRFSPRSPRSHSIREELAMLSGKKFPDSPRKVNLDRSLSVSDLCDHVNMESDIVKGKSIDDPLSSPVVPTWMLDSMSFDKRYGHIENMMEWLTRWSGRNHKLDGCLYGNDNGVNTNKSAIRVKVPPKMVMYSLWLLENCYNPPPSVRQSMIPPTEIIVAAVHHSQDKEKSSRKDKRNRDSPKEEENGQSERKKRSSKRRRKHRGSDKESADRSPRVSDDRNTVGKSRDDSKSNDAVAENVAIKRTPPTGHSRQRMDSHRHAFTPTIQPPEDQRSVGMGSETTADETLSVSSLGEEELHQTMKETLRKLQGTMHVEELKTSTTVEKRTASSRRSERESRMNSTLHYPPGDDDIESPNPAQTRQVTGQERMEVTGSDRGQSTIENNSNMSGIAQELQGIVRQELRNIMEAQQRGILAMMGALDNHDTLDGTMPFTNLSNGHVANGMINSHGIPEHQSKKSQKAKRADCTIMSVQADVHPNLEKHSSSDIEVTPLPSDQLTSSDKPLSLSDLNKENNPLPVQQQKAQPVRTDRSGLVGALRQLKLLEVDHRGHQGDPGLNPFTGPSQINALHVPNQMATPNQMTTPPNQMTTPPNQMTVPPNQMTTPPNQMTGFPEHSQPPFGRLMNLLRDVNPDLAGISWPLQGQPRFLRLQPAGAESLHLPQIPGLPRLAWQDAPTQLQPQSQPGPTGSSHMPYIPSQPPRYRMQDIPEKDSGPLPGVSHRSEPHLDPQAGHRPFPLLSINQPDHYGFERDQFGVPRLIPPGDIIQYEQQRYQSSVMKKKEVHDFIQEQMANQMAAQNQPQPIGKKLLMPDVFEPFGPLDERDKSTRERHRKKKASEDTKKVSPRSRADKRRKGKSKASVGSDEESDIARTEQEHTDTDMVEIEPVAQTQAYDVRSSPCKSESSSSPRKSLDTEDVRINHGYALTPGLFDEYLKEQDELGSAADTNARIQYRAAMGVQTTPRLTKRDAATDATTSDKGTSITRDTGTDPVAEAIQKYYRAKTGHTSSILLPDVFLGLRYEDINKMDASDSSAQTNRAFLNVVDINADMLDEITSTVAQRQDKQQEQDRDRHKLKLHSERAKSPDRGAIAEEDIPLGPDSLTQQLLSQPGSHVDRLTAEDAIYGSRRVKTKDAIRKRLDDMNSQFSAIESMSHNIEQDFKNSELLLHTIEQMGVALDPPDEPIPLEDRRKWRAPEEDHEIYQDYHGPKPSAVRIKEPSPRSGPSSPRKPGTPREERKSPRAGQIRDSHEDDQSMDQTSPRLEHSGQQRSPGREVRNQSGEVERSRDMDLSGLSGVSDILGEMLKRGDMDATDLGLTQKQADQLAERAMKSSRDGVRLSQEELQTIFKKATDSKKQKRTEAQRKEVQEWMSKKHAERQHEYKQRLGELREAERNPFHATLPNNVTTQTLKNQQELELTKRRERGEENTRRRQELAAELMGDILTDQLPIPSEPETHTPRTTIKSKHRTGMAGKTVVRKVAGTQPRPSSAHRARSKSPQRDLDRMTIPIDQYMDIRNSYDNTAQGIDTRTKVFQPRRFAEKVDPSNVENIPPRSRPSSAPVRRESAPPDPSGAQRHKPLAEMVRLQRPEATRNKRRVKPMTYAERLSMLKGEGSTARSSSNSVRDQQRLYGTKRIPGSGQKSERRAPRTVKTYTERLQDMKPQTPATQHYEPSVHRRPPPEGSAAAHYPSRQEVEHRGISPRRPRKTLTYAEQLQQLQPPKDTQRTGKDTITLHPGPPRRSYKPAHKPKTYAEQLQELQKPGANHRDAYGPSQPKLYRTRPAKSLVRPRPYTAPYMDDMDRLSVVSPWSMDEDVQDILYGGDDVNQREYASMAEGDIEGSDMSDIQYIGDEPYDDQHYADMVDVGDLQELASVSEGSIMSFIDWDQVDQLISDIN